MPEIESIEALYRQSRRQRRCIIPPDATSRRTLARRVLQGVVVRPLKGLYAERAYWQTLTPNDQALHIIRALAVLHPDWVFAGPSAALLHGLDCPYALAGTIYRTVARTKRTMCQNGITCIPLRARDSSAVQRIDGIQATSVTTTVYDCAAMFRPSFAMEFADSALRLGKTDAASMQAVAQARRHDRNWRKATQLIALANGLSENGGESRCRGALHECGAAMPQLQVSVPCLDDPRAVHRIDMVWLRPDGSAVGCEFDGTGKYADPAMTGTRDIRQVVSEERKRQHCLERRGIDIFRLNYGQLDELGEIRRLLHEYRVPTDEGILRNLGAWSL